MLTFLTLAGSGPATLLRRVCAWPVRLSLMPVVGFCTATCVFTTTAWFFPASSTCWIFLILATGSFGLAVFLTRSDRRVSTAAADPVLSGAHSRRRRVLVGFLQCGIVAVVVSIPIALIMIEQHSVGPATYQVYDTDSYLAMQDGLQHQSLDEARVTHTGNKDLVQNLYSSLADTSQDTEMSPVAANLNELLGLDATETQSAYLLALLVVGGLGLFGAICVATGTVSWWAIFGGCLFGGAFFMQLYFDGSEGAICGLITLLPLGAVSIAAVRAKQRHVLIVPAIILSALFALYPIFLSVVGVTTGAALVIATLKSGALRNRSWRSTINASASLVAVIAVAIAMDLVGFLRAWQVWVHVLNTNFANVGFPNYHLTATEFPGWFFQTTGFYSFATPPTPMTGTIAALVVPLIVLAVVLPAVRRNPFAWLVVPAVLTVVIGAHHQVATESCSYCEDRNLLPMSVLLFFLVGLGVVILALKRPLLAVAIALLGAGFMSYAGYNESNRYATGAYLLPTSLRSVVEKIPTHSGTVDLEAFDAAPNAPGEFPLAYDLVYEATDHQVSAPADQLGDPGLAYVYVHPLNGILGEIFDPNYRFILTRIPSVSTTRITLATGPGIALEERGTGLDVTVDGGLSVAQADDSDGLAYVVGPVNFIISGTSRRTPSVLFSLALPPNLPPSDLAALSRLGSIDTSTETFSGCVGTTSVATVDSVYAPRGISGLHIGTAAIPGNLGIRLTSMRATVARCSR